MAFTSSTVNPGSGGDLIATQTSGGLKYPAGCVVYGPDGGTLLLAGITQGLPVQITDGQKVTYSVSTPVAGVVPAASCTDLFELNNSVGSKTIMITRIEFSMSAGTAGLFPITLLKRSTLNTSGTSATPAITPHDSADNAATAVLKTYTVNPTTGALVGNIRSLQYNAILTGNPNIIVWAFGNLPGCKPIKLLASQSLCINLGGASVSSGLAFVSFEFSEQ